MTVRVAEGSGGGWPGIEWGCECEAGTDGLSGNKGTALAPVRLGRCASASSPFCWEFTRQLASHSQSRLRN